MTTVEAINYFGSRAALAVAIGKTESYVWKWGVFPPEGMQYKIQAKTKGKLKAEEEQKAAGH
jgi:hypothetical protein